MPLQMAVVCDNLVVGSGGREWEWGSSVYQRMGMGVIGLPDSPGLGVD